MSSGHSSLQVCVYMFTVVEYRRSSALTNHLNSRARKQTFAHGGFLLKYRNRMPIQVILLRIPVYFSRIWFLSTPTIISLLLQGYLSWRKQSFSFTVPLSTKTAIHPRITCRSVLSWYGTVLNLQPDESFHLSILLVKTIHVVLGSFEKLLFIIPLLRQHCSYAYQFFLCITLNQLEAIIHQFLDDQGVCHSYWAAPQGDSLTSSICD